MISIGKVGSPDYYLDRVCRDVEAYYSGHGEAPGEWLGGGAAALGLSGEVSPDDLRALLDGSDPLTGEALGQRPRVNGLRAWDLTCSAPKGYSVLMALTQRSDPEAHRLLVEAHDGAVRAALGYLESVASHSRVQEDGQRTLAESSGFVAAAYRHRSSRCGDPQLHTHVLVANRVQNLDGQWRTVNGSELYRQKMTAAALFRAELRNRVASLGLEWAVNEKGLSEPTDVPLPVRRHYSKRRVEIEKRMAELGVSGARAAQVATLETRKSKTQVDAASLFFRWAVEAEELGFGPRVAARVLRESRLRVRDVDLEARTEHDVGMSLQRALGPLGLTEHASTFDQRDVVRHLADWTRNGASTARVLAAAETAVGSHPDLVRITDGEVRLRRSDGLRLGWDRPGRRRWVPFGGSHVRWSTRELLALEGRLVEEAVSRQGVQAGVVAPEVVERALASAKVTLNEGQSEAVRSLLSSGDGVELLVAPAGTGKTTAMGAATEGWRAAGFHVLGGALSARAASQLSDETGMPTFTLAQMVGDILDPRWTGFDRNTVVVIDEAGQAGTRYLAVIADEVAKADAKLVLVGDHRQLPEVDAGGVFGGLVRRLRVLTLTENMRQQHDPELVDRLNRLRDSANPVQVMREFDTNGQVVRANSLTDLLDRMTVDWSTYWLPAGHTGRDVLAGQVNRSQVAMLALTNVDAAELNDRARVLLRQAGVLSGPAVVSQDGRDWQVGDHVVSRKNARRYGLLNGDRWVVSAVHPDGDNPELSVQRLSRRRGRLVGKELRVPADYLAEGHLQHGYAVTVNVAQGATYDRVFMRGSEATYREALYVAASRPKRPPTFYTMNREKVDPCGYDPRAGVFLGEDAPDPFDRFAEAAGRSRAQLMALDTPPEPEPTFRPVGSQFIPSTPLLGLRQELDVLRRIVNRDQPPDVASAIAELRAELPALREQAAHAARLLADAEQAAQPVGLLRRIPATSQQRVVEARRSLSDSATAVDEAEGRLVGLSLARLEREVWDRQQGPLLRRVDALEDAVAGRLSTLGRRAEHDPRMIEFLGPCPPVGEQRDRWLAAAGGLAGYREQFADRDSPLDGLLAGPTETRLQADTLAETRLLVGEVDTSQPGLDHGLDLDVGGA